MKVAKIRIEALTRDRDQCFAEAADLYRQGARWWPDRAFEVKHIKPQQDARYEADVWGELIAGYLLGRRSTTILELAREALHLDAPRSARPINGASAPRWKAWGGSTGRL